MIIESSEVGENGSIFVSVSLGSLESPNLQTELMTANVSHVEQITQKPEAYIMAKSIPA